MDKQQTKERSFVSLSGLQRQIKDAITSQMDPVLWIVTEISEMHTNYSGHCYMELIEKDAVGGSIVAKSKATIWANTFAMLRPYFEQTTEQVLQAGMSVMIKVSVDFHPVYGLSVNVRDIDPVYTLGEQQRQRMAVLQQLEDEGIIDMNAELALPEVIESIAVISSATAAGFGDFMNQMQSNQYGKRVNIELFAATMQGDSAPESIMRQLDRIYEKYDSFDAVVIIRGGGAAADLLCFDDYLLASHIAQFPIPVITGIGHERDQTIADRVAHTSVKTPTAAAEFIIGVNTKFGSILNELLSRMQNSTARLIQQKYSELEQKALLLPQSVKSGVQKQLMRLDFSQHLFAQKTEHIIKADRRLLEHIGDKMAASVAAHNEHQRKTLENAEKAMSQSCASLIERRLSVLIQNEQKMKISVSAFLNKENHRMDIVYEQAKQLDPTEQLKRGYTMTFADGKKIRSIDDVTAGKEISTALLDGDIVSSVVTINKR